MQRCPRRIPLPLLADLREVGSVLLSMRLQVPCHVPRVKPCPIPLSAKAIGQGLTRGTGHGTCNRMKGPPSTSKSAKEGGECVSDIVDRASRRHGVSRGLLRGSRHATELHVGIIGMLSGSSEATRCSSAMRRMSGCRGRLSEHAFLSRRPPTRDRALRRHVRRCATCARPPGSSPDL